MDNTKLSLPSFVVEIRLPTRIPIILVSAIAPMAGSVIHSFNVSFA